MHVPMNYHVIVERIQVNEISFVNVVLVDSVVVIILLSI
ncbi:unnamed protein product [Trichobilharzia regenti]|nr:unnamed protein product [Trichobilharzia regenti]